MSTGTTGANQRIGDHPLAFGIRRYADSDDNAKWEFSVHRGFCGSTMTSHFLSVKDLIAIKAFCDKAIKLIQTDGGRKKEESDARPE